MPLIGSIKRINTRDYSQRLYCANVGDSRTLLCRNFKPIALSVDHKPSREDEAKRIRDAGGFVINNR